MQGFIRVLRTQGERFGRLAWMFYALVFLLTTTSLLGLVYLIFGWLIVQSPNGVLVLTGVLVLLIFYIQFRRKR